MRASPQKFNAQAGPQRAARDGGMRGIGVRDEGSKDSRGPPVNLLWQLVQFFSFIPSQRASLFHVHSTPAPILSLCRSISFSHPEGILSSTIGSVVNKKGTHQSRAETSGGERSKFASNLIRNEADWWRFEEGWWSSERQQPSPPLRQVAEGRKGWEIRLSIRKTNQADALYRHLLKSVQEMFQVWTEPVPPRAPFLKLSLIILLPFQRNIWITAAEWKSEKSN